MTELAGGVTLLPARRPHRVLRPWFDRLVATAIPLAAWQIAATADFVHKWFSSPADVVQRIWEMLLDGSLLQHSWQTFQEAILGLVFGVLLGTALGVLLGRWRRLSEAVDPVMMGIYSLPRVSLAPLFILWLGIGLLAKVGLVISVVLFLVLFTVREGVKQIDVDLINALRTMNAPRSVMLRHVILPSLVPWILASVRISIGAALIGAVVGEMMGASQGLGWYVTYTSGIYDITGSITGLVVLCIMAMLLNAAVAWIERRVLHWQSAATELTTQDG